MLCTFIVWTSDMPELRSTVNSAKQMQHSFLIVHCSEHAAFPQFVFLPSPSLLPMQALFQKKVTLFLKCQESLGTGLSHQSTTHTHKHPLECRKIQLRCYTSYWLNKFLLARHVASYQIMSQCEPNFIPRLCSTFHNL